MPGYTQRNEMIFKGRNLEKQPLYFPSSCMITLLVLNDFVFNAVSCVAHYQSLQGLFPIIMFHKRTNELIIQ